ncbi:MAG: LysR family transcriptional regulator [Burkholderiaceae bacterium]|nr:LysR family transcriptional regulator [Burkholderiaceae bacterium]
MARKPLPPLNALRAFEATARNLSLTAAASELHVTPPAVSHQLKTLEDYLGFALFQRLRKGVKLTEKGAAYFFRISKALEGVANATEDIRQSPEQPTLSLAVPPHFLSGWMVPRLPKLIQKRRLTNIRITDTVRKVDFEGEGVDAQIYWGAPTWSGVVLEPLVDDELCLVCSPEFVARFGPFSGLEDLRDAPLIHTDRRPVNWDRLFHQAGAERSKSAKSLTFLRPLPVVEAARHGLGIAIASRLCVSDLLSTGALVVPFSLQIRATQKLVYSLVRPARASSDSRLDYLRDWLRLELKTTSLSGFAMPSPNVVDSRPVAG